MGKCTHFINSELPTILAHLGISNNQKITNLNLKMSSQMNSTPPVNIVFDAFKDAGFCLPLVALMSSKALVCLIGIVLNADLVMITFKTKKLRGACNLQIALNSLSICVQQSSSFVAFFVVISGINFIPLRLCGILQLLPMFCTIFTTGMGFSIGIDRLLSVCFPIWYLSHDKRPYFYSICIFCSIFASIGPIVALKVSTENPNLEVMCTVIDSVGKEAAWITILQLIVNCASVLCYLLVWGIIWGKKNGIKRKQVNIFNSLFAILLLEIGGWIANYALRIALNSPNISSLNIWYIVNVATIIPYATLTVNPLILFLFSIEYRRAFLHQFSRVGNQQNISTVGTSNGNLMGDRSGLGRSNTKWGGAKMMQNKNNNIRCNERF